MTKSFREVMREEETQGIRRGKLRRQRRSLKGKAILKFREDANARRMTDLQTSEHLARCLI